MLKKLNSFEKVIQNIKTDNTPVLVTGVLDTQKSHLLSCIFEENNKTALILAPDENKAREIYSDLYTFCGDTVSYYPAKDTMDYIADVKSKEYIFQRFSVLNDLINDKKSIIVASVCAVTDNIISKEVLKEHILKIKSDDTINLDLMARKLVFMGYERCDMIEGRGQFSIRGGILDIFPSTRDSAVRIELWGDDIDAIKSLDHLSQRSIENIDEFEIFPVKECVFTDNDLEKAIEKLSEEENTLPIIERFERENNFSGAEKYIGYFYDEKKSILDYLPEDSIIYFDEPKDVLRALDDNISQINEILDEKIESGGCKKIREVIFQKEEILKKTLAFNIILYQNFARKVDYFRLKDIVNFNVKPALYMLNNFDSIKEDLEFLIKKDYTVMFYAGSLTKANRVVSELVSRDIPAQLYTGERKTGVVYVLKGSLSKGFEYPDIKLSFVSDSDIFKKEKKKKSKKKKGSNIEHFTDLKIGDYVVHENHGIGIFSGIEKIVKEGVSKDYLKIKYDGTGVIYVNVNQMDLIQKYIGGENKVPKLNKLGSVKWENAKNKTRLAVKALAFDLVELYAKRQAEKGFMYSKDTLWQREFEEDFPFTETDDQIDAINDMKRDMESGIIMDRLICGDVGFGKTEVAIRGAFKAVQDGKQVAMLVPTTILADQHYNNFLQRMKNYPVNIEMLSRFRTPTQQRNIIKKVKEGKIDILIGTHRILSKDIEFRDLGLLIIDEEQRFGVGHKEKLKNLKNKVDVLTLTATPIPRTLHMSLSGIRNMSVLTQPPEDRLPVQTYVTEYDEQVIKQGILRELSRGGQVFYLHNRVNNISEVATRVQNLVPEANVSYAHGQMTESELERVMLAFNQREIDVLVCTTIIESGIDMPNVNTLIVTDADRLGLSQLYQLRGRVGRSNKRAFAYLMYRRDKVLNEASEKRLKAIRDFTEFGSGFKIALRDLEIRGAGNLIGAEQHGNMDAVGYDLYCKLLDRAIKNLKGEQLQEEIEMQIEISADAYIPSRYISNEEQKLEMYKKISLIYDDEDYFDLQDEFMDRFGQMPRAVINLMDIGRLKAVAKKLGVVSIIEKSRGIVISFSENIKFDVEKLLELSKTNRRLMVTANSIVYKNKGEAAINELREVFEQIIN